MGTEKAVQEREDKEEEEDIEKAEEEMGMDVDDDNKASATTTTTTAAAAAGSDDNDAILKQLHGLLLETAVMEGKLVCGNCGFEYPIKDGVGNFLLPAHLV